MSGTLIISTWGSPFRWLCADYTGDGVSVRSCCTLPYLTTRYEGSDVIVVVLDSLIDVSDAHKGPGTCGTCSSKCLSKYWNGSVFSSYNDVEARVRDFTKCVIDCIYMHECACSSYCRRPHSVEVIVGPSVGSPGGRWNFKGNVGDFTGKVLFEVSTALDRVLSERCNISTLVLDLTHGINFMPSAILSLADKIVSLIIMKQPGEVRVEVYNSDPYPPRVEQKGEVCCRDVTGTIPVLNVNLVGRRRVKEIVVPHAFPGKLAEPTRGHGDPQVRDAINVLGKLRASMDWARRVLSSLYYPLPLMLVYACNDPSFAYSNAKTVLDRVLEIWKVGVKMSGTSVERVFRLNDEDIYALILASYTCESLKRKLLERPSLDKGVSIESLDRLKDIYYRVSEVHGTLVEHEISIVKETVDKIRQGQIKMQPGCTTLAQLKQAQKLRERVDKRIMIAHTGFQDDFTELCIDSEGNITLKYSKDYKELLEGLLIREQP